jgi:hypothetical protein
VQFRVLKEKDPNPVKVYNLPANEIPQHGEELTLEDRVPLNSLAPGKYKLEVAITDNLAKQTITPFADFTVKPAPAASQGPQGR